MSGVLKQVMFLPVINGMRIKTILIVLVTVLLTVILMQNTGRDSFNVLWETVNTSKLTMLIVFALAGFIIGLLIGRPGKVRQLAPDETTTIESNKHTNTLSDEDRDYIT